MALTNAQTRVKQTTRVQIIVGGSATILQTEANNFISSLEATGVNYAVNVGDPSIYGSEYCLRITYTSIEYLIEEATGV